MRTAALFVIGAVACAAPAAGDHGAAIVGGSADGRAAAVQLDVAGGPCSGVLVAPRVVLTAGHCAAQLGSVHVGAGAPWDETLAIVEARRARDYRVDDLGTDLALVRLATPSAATPALVRAATPTGLRSLEVVGFGRQIAAEPSSSGTRRTAILAVAALGDGVVITDGAGPGFTCAGDSGAPAFDDAGQVVATVAAGDPSCAGPTTLTRLDRHAAWIAAVVAAWDGPCAADGACATGCATIDPDCDRCGLDGTCAPGCAAPDLDCPLGRGPGVSCDADVDCESRRCVVAPDDATSRFCSAACADDGASCPAPLTSCAAGVCVYPGPTPGQFGAACTDDDACRSGVCDRGTQTCTRACALGCPDGYGCGAAGPGPVCRRLDDGCAVGGTGSLGGVAGLLALITARRSSAARRRRRSPPR